MIAAAIGIDIGTSGVRAALVDAGGAPLGFSAARLAPEERRTPTSWWWAVESALAALTASADLSGVGCIAVDGTSGTIVMLNESGQPMGEASLYNDPAPGDAVRAAAAAAPAGSAAVGPASPLAKLLSLQGVPGTARLSHQADWIAARLGAPAGISDENNALKTGYDPVRRCWPGWLHELGIRMALLPDVAEPGTPIGTIDPALAARFGLPAGVSPSDLCPGAVGRPETLIRSNATAIRGTGPGICQRSLSNMKFPPLACGFRQDFAELNVAA